MDRLLSYESKIQEAIAAEDYDGARQLVDAYRLRVEEVLKVVPEDHADLLARVQRVLLSFHRAVLCRRAHLVRDLGIIGVSRPYSGPRELPQSTCSIEG